MRTRMRIFQVARFSLGCILSKIAPPWSSPTVKKFEHLSSRRLSSGGDDDEAVAAQAVAVLVEQRRRSRWNFLKTVVGADGLTAAQTVKIIARLKNKPHLALRFFHCSAARRDISSYAAIVHVLARNRVRRPAVSLLRAALSQADHATGPVLAAMLESYRACDSTPLALDLLLRACRLDQAMHLVRTGAVSPGAATRNELVRASVASSGADAGLAVYAELFDGKSTAAPDVQTFNSLLLALYREGRIKEGEEVLREMERRSCRGNSFTISVRMAALCDAGKVPAAEALFQEMNPPDAAAYNAMIGGFCQAGDMVKAEELLKRMVNEGITPTLTGYERLIEGYCAAGDDAAAARLYEEMARAGIRPGPSTVARLVAGLCEKKRFEEGMQLVKREIERGEEEGMIIPLKETFVALIKGFCEEGLMEKAIELQAAMAAGGISPDEEICKIFINGYHRKGDEETARKLFDEMRSRLGTK